MFSISRSLIVTVAFLIATGAMAQTAGWTENNGKTTTPNDVGIGNTNPLTIFHVTRNLAFVHGHDAQGIFGGTGSTPQTTLIGYDTVNDYGFIQSGQYNSTWFKNLALQPKDGRVGVGITNPVGLFHSGKNMAFVNGGDAQGIFGGTGTTPQTTLIGYDTTNDYGFIQAAQYGATWSKNLALQPKGGKVGIGKTTPQYALDVVGDANFTGTVTGTNIQAKYQDIAEWVPAAESVTPGTVVVLHRARVNEVVASSAPYETTVAGVVSPQPGILLGEPSAGKVAIATTGRVRVKADATSHPIAIGDLLVTSGARGMAMYSEPIDVGGAKIHRPGTLIGKALEPLERGTGEILVLLSLQ